MQGALSDWAVEETAAADIGDGRLNRRFGNLLNILASSPNKTIPSACSGWSETLAAYRFFDNERVRDILS